MGAILKTRLPVSLNDATCTITLSVSSTKMPPHTTSVNSFLVSTASMPSAPPSESEPTSPMNTAAGYVLNHKKPVPAPIIAPQKIANSPEPWIYGIFKYSAILNPRMTVPAPYARMRNVAEQKMTGPMASPSSPSVMLTPLDAPTMTMMASAIYAGSHSDSGCL